MNFTQFQNKTKAMLTNKALFCILVLILWLLCIFYSPAERYSHTGNPFTELRGTLYLCGLFIILSAVCIGFAYLKKTPVFPSCGSMLLILGTACAFNLLSNINPYVPTGSAFSSIFSTAGFICLSWVALKRFSLIFWIPFLLFDFIQLIVYLRTGLLLNNDLILAEIIDASWSDILPHITLSNIAAVVGGLLLIGVAAAFMCRSMRSVSWLTLLAFGFTTLSLAGVECILTSPSHRVGCLWPFFETMATVKNAREAIEFNSAHVDYLKNLPSPSAKPSSIQTIQPNQGAVLVLHIGESVRADRLSLNGYLNKGRSTTPWLDSQKSSWLINFSDSISSSSSTGNAIATILTDARRDVLPNVKSEFTARAGSVLELFDANGFSVYSFMGTGASQTGKYDRVISLLISCSKMRFCAPGLSHTILPRIEQVLKEAPLENKVFFINNEGSHLSFYAFDSAHAPFQPASPHSKNPREEPLAVNNAYDNTIYYTDAYIRKVNEKLKGRPYIYLYISDHGEYLGHDGTWYRGKRGSEYLSTSASRVGMFVITSPEFEALHPHFAEAVKNLRKNADMTVGHEHIYHTLLGIFGISTPYYDARLDLSSENPEPYSGPKPATPPQPDSHPATLQPAA